MYVDKELRNRVDYKFMHDRSNRPIAQVIYRDNPIAVLSVPTYESDIESAQKFIYATVRAFIRMTEPSK